MKLSEATLLCEGTSRAFTEVYKLYNFKDEDDLRAYCDFVIHEPVEWMRGFPAAWKSATMFSKPRAAFHRLMKLASVVDILGAEYCENVHEVVWNAFKTHMTPILEKRGRHGVAVTTTQDSDNESEKSGSAESDVLTADSFDLESVIEQVPPVPEPPKNSLSWFGGGDCGVSKMERPLDYKQKYEVTLRVLRTLLGTGGLDEASRLRAALNLLLSEYERA